MSVFKRSGKETYEYDFWYRGHRFCGGTGEANKREAVAYEKRRKEEAKKEVVARLAAETAIRVPRTWDVAASRYWHEVGQHHKNADTTFACLAWLTLNIGAGTALEAIDSNKVALLVAKRRQSSPAPHRAMPRPWISPSVPVAGEWKLSAYAGLWWTSSPGISQ